MNLFDFFMKTSFLVKVTILVLTVFSVLSWTIIIKKMLIFRSANYERETFEKKFWSNIELSQLYQQSHSRRDSLFGTEQIFYSGFKEFIHFHQHNNSLTFESIILGISRAMHIAMNREVEILETSISFLGTIGSVSPYIGLFGTVGGIMHSFIKLGSIKQATLQMVAPGISEALITTAIGLFVSIPAVIAFNRFNQNLDHVELHYNNFIEEFIAILHRQLLFSNENIRTVKRNNNE